MDKFEKQQLKSAKKFLAKIPEIEGLMSFRNANIRHFTKEELWKIIHEIGFVKRKKRIL